MSQRMPYSINTDVRFDPLELIDISKIIAECQEDWFNQTLSKVNDSVVRLGIVRGEFHWHKHDEEDEFFYVVDGQFFIDLEGRTVELGPRQGFMVPKGVMHNTRAPEGAVILMIEKASVIPTGN